MNLPRRLIWIVLLGAAVFGGCATPDTVSGGPRRPPASTTLATVYLLDGIETSLLGGGELVVANAAPIAVVSRRQYTWFQVPPGKVQLCLNDSTQTSQCLAARVFEAEPGKSYYFRYMVQGTDLPPIVLLVDALKKKPADLSNYNSADIRPISPEAASVLIDAYDVVHRAQPH